MLRKQTDFLRSHIHPHIEETHPRTYSPLRASAGEEFRVEATKAELPKVLQIEDRSTFRVHLEIDVLLRATGQLEI